MAFEADKRYGDTGVDAVVRYLSRLGFYCNTPPGEFRAYDIHARATLEVKRDRQAAETGNLFVETSAHGKPSGIGSSQATAYVFIMEGKAYFVTTEALRAIVPTLQIRNARDGKAGCILPVRILEALPFVHRADFSELL